MMELGANEKIFSPRLDLVFKSMFTQDAPESRGALMDFLSSVIGKEIADVTVHENELAVGGISEKQSTMDINCKFNDGEQANIEIQVNNRGNMGTRAEYHICKLHSGQPIKGRNYSALRSTYQITLTDFAIYPDDIYLDEFRYASVNGRLLWDGKTHIYLIELTKLRRLLQEPMSALTRADMWALYIKYVDDESQRPLINHLIEQEEGLKMASEILRKLAKDDAMRIAVYAQDKAETDRLAEIAWAIDKGKEEGRQEGRQEGRDEYRLELITPLIQKKMKIDDISEILQIPPDEIKKILGRQS